jgi:L-iditol 2-dehydrogenase
MRGTLVAMPAPGELRVEEHEVPDPGPGAATLQIRRANLCGSELHIFRGHHPLIREGVLGHEFVGEIAALGEGVTTDYAGEPIAIGDRVVSCYYLTCQRCPACLHGDFNLCRNAYAFWSKPAREPPHFHGAFATHYYVHPNQYFYKVPDEVPDAVVAGANCGLSQVLYALHRWGLSAGQHLVVQGAGGLGIYAVAVARELGAHVTVVEAVPERIALAREFGAHDVIDIQDLPDRADRVARAHELVSGSGPDMVLEVAGVPAAFNEAVEKVRPGGTVLVIGNVNVGAEFETPFAPGLITRKGVHVIGIVRYLPWFLHRSLAFLARNHDRYPWSRLTDQSYDLQQVGEAIAHAEARSVARPVILPT